MKQSKVTLLSSNVNRQKQLLYWGYLAKCQSIRLELNLDEKQLVLKQYPGQLLFIDCILLLVKSLQLQLTGFC